MPNIVWMQAGACSGESMALLCADRPSLENLLQQYDLKLLWHPSLTADASFGQVLEAITSGREKVDILCIEGSLMTGPDGSGQYDTWKGRAKIDIGLAKGKKLHDKRDSEKDRDWVREKDRLFKQK